MKKFLFLIFFFLFLIVFQPGFFSHFSLWGITPNFILIFLVILNFLEDSQKKSGIVIAGFSGFLLDFFSGLQFGVYFLTFIFMAFLIKKFLKSLGEENIVYFSLIFLASFLFYNLAAFVLNSFLKFSFVVNFNLNKLDFFETIYNLSVAVVFFVLIDHVRKNF